MFTYGEMEKELNDAGYAISDTSIWRELRAKNWNTRARGRTAPLLTEKHRNARVAYAKEMIDEDWAAHVDLDEK